MSSGMASNRLLAVALITLLWSANAKAVDILEPQNGGTAQNIERVEVLVDSPLRHHGLRILLDGRRLKVAPDGPPNERGQQTFHANVPARLRPGPHRVRTLAATTQGRETNQVTFYVPGARPVGAACRSHFSCQTLFCATVLDTPQQPREADIEPTPRAYFGWRPGHCALPLDNGARCRSSLACASRHCLLDRVGQGTCEADSDTEDLDAAVRLPQDDTRAPDAQEVQDHILDGTMLGGPSRAGWDRRDWHHDDWHGHAGAR